MKDFIPASPRAVTSRHDRARRIAAIMSKIERGDLSPADGHKAIKAARETSLSVVDKFMASLIA